ncbi:MAG: excinuclease ABC subunit UvrC [Lachnospiraceae bacterium]|nr:excinuclease ABC subunit UvrC [Lachnospiraceae bacterium]
MEFDIEENLKQLPKRPGVYIMHAENDEIIYVGKAVNLFNRVHSYFRATKKSAKIERMVEKISYFETIVTDSELEALILECNLIKTHRPPYNTLLKDDKSYPYIKVTVGEEYPRIIFTRKPHGDTGAFKTGRSEKTKAQYFGPYTSAGSVRETIELINRIFKLRTCNRVLPKDIGKERPCLNYQINQCSGPCREGAVSRESYLENVRGALEFLEGNYRPILDRLKGEMEKAAEELRFEDAAGIRDLIGAVSEVAQKQKITSSDGEDRDVIGLARNEKDAVVAVFFVRDGRIIGRDHFDMTETEGVSDAEILGSFVRQFYTGTPFIPPQIILEEEIEEIPVIEEALKIRRGGKVTILTPKRGFKEKLARLAKKNAELILNTDRERKDRERKRTQEAAAKLAELLGIEKAERIESYDISNISGFLSVGSMVVFENGRGRTSDYRKFRIKTVEGPDDYASMDEVLTRRFKRLLEAEEAGNDSFTRYPDLILMDGGKGQVNVALKVLEKLGLDLPVAGMVKDDCHRTRGLYFNNEELPIDTHSELFKLVTRIQDETHRFAITYHRSLRDSAQVHSILNDIEGIGDKRRKALLMAFGSLEAIAEASKEELEAVPGMNAKAAEAVRAFFDRRKRNTYNN